MSMFDWNGDGKNDMFDDMMEYQIYRDVMGENDNDIHYSSKPKKTYVSSGKTSNSNNSGMGCATSFAITVMCIIAIILMAWVGSSLKSCGSSKSTNSYSSSYKRSYSYSSSKDYSSKSSSTTSTSKPTYSSSSTNYSGYNNRNYSSSKSNKSSSDPYNAKDYYDADDFYYDHYDDFWDYEDAEDYYNDHN